MMKFLAGGLCLTNHPMYVIMHVERQLLIKDTHIVARPKAWHLEGPARAPLAVAFLTKLGYPVSKTQITRNQPTAKSKYFTTKSQGNQPRTYLDMPLNI